MAIKRVTNAVKQSKAHPGADCDSDHTTVNANVDIKFKKGQKREQCDWKAMTEREKNMKLSYKRGSKYWRETKT